QRYDPRGLSARKRRVSRRAASSLLIFSYSFFLQEKWNWGHFILLTRKAFQSKPTAIARSCARGRNGLWAFPLRKEGPRHRHCASRPRGPWQKTIATASLVGGGDFSVSWTLTCVFAKWQSRRPGGRNY